MEEFALQSDCVIEDLEERAMKMEETEKETRKETEEYAFEKYASRIRTWLESTQEEESSSSDSHLSHKLVLAEKSPYLRSQSATPDDPRDAQLEPLDLDQYSEAILKGYKKSTSTRSGGSLPNDTQLSPLLSPIGEHSEHHALLGMALVAASAVCYAALNLSVKAVMEKTPWQEIMLIRMFVTWLATLLWIKRRHGTILSLWGPPSRRILLSLRAFFLWGAMFCCFWSFEFLPVGDAVTLAMSFPVWVAMIGHFVNHEDPAARMDWLGWVFILTGMAGSIFVAQPSFLFKNDIDERFPNRDVGAVIGLVSVVCSASQFIIVNYTRESCHWLQVEHITAFLSTFVLMPIGYVGFAFYEYYATGHATLQWSNLSFFHWMEEIGLGLLGFVGLALLTRGSQLDVPGRTALCFYIQIPIIYTAQCFITQEVPNYLLFVGVTFILASVAIPAIRRVHKVKRADRNVHRHRLEVQKLRGQSNSDERFPLLSADIKKYCTAIDRLSEDSSGEGDF